MINIGNVVLGKGLAKICIPVVGQDEEKISKELDLMAGLDFDVVEFRLDCFDGFADYTRLEGVIELIRKRLNKPIILTFRTKKEGGRVDLSDGEYLDMIEEFINKKLAEAVDIEYMRDQDRLLDLVSLAKAKGVTVILSNHEFSYSPAREEIVARLEDMINMGADVAKIALMPTCPDDVLNLLGATSQVKSKHPDQDLITVSMGQMGSISRLAGGVFGSDMTFASALEESAPGQISAQKMRDILKVLG